MPNSVLWVCLVAVWLFVLVPMVIKGRPQILKSTDAAKRTRLLHRGGSRARSAASARRRSSARHPHDPNWKPSRRATATAVLEADEDTHVEDTEAEDTEAEDTATETAEAATRVQRVARVEAEKPEVEVDETVLDLERDTEDKDADATGESDADAETEVEPTDDADLDDEAVEGLVEAEHDDAEAAEADDSADAEYDDPEEVDDTDAFAGAEYEEEAEHEAPEYEDAEYEDAEYEDAEYDTDAEYEDELEATDDLDEDEYDDYARGTRSSEPAAEAAVADDEVEGDEPVSRAVRPERRARRNVYSSERERELKYKERQRVTLSLFVLLILAIVAGIVLGTPGWIATGLAGLMLVGYLAYLRRAVKVEQQIRAQRAARARRAALAEEERRRRAAAVPEFAAAPPPARLRRPGGVVVLEIDDEDPVFDHLPPYQRRRMEREDLEYRRVG